MRKLVRVDPARRKEILRQVEAFARQLKEELPVEEVYLHGSFAQGDVHEGSDIDLVIVGDFKERFPYRIGRILRMTTLPIEPLVYTREEFEEMKRSGNPFISTVLSTGRAL